VPDLLDKLRRESRLSDAGLSDDGDKSAPSCRQYSDEFALK